MYELFVLCRREPPAPPGGFSELEGEPRVDELSLDGYWSETAARFLRAAPAAVVRVHRTEEGSLSVMTSLAKAIADAGDGVVLSRVPVTMPWRFDVEHEGRAALADWTALLGRAEHYREEERRELEEDRRKRAEEKARWEAKWGASGPAEASFSGLLKKDGDK